MEKNYYIFKMKILKQIFFYKFKNQYTNPYKLLYFF